MSEVKNTTIKQYGFPLLFIVMFVLGFLGLRWYYISKMHAPSEEEASSESGGGGGGGGGFGGGMPIPAPATTPVVKTTTQGKYTIKGVIEGVKPADKLPEEKRKKLVNAQILNENTATANNNSSQQQSNVTVGINAPTQYTGHATALSHLNANGHYGL